MRRRKTGPNSTGQQVISAIFHVTRKKGTTRRRRKREREREITRIRWRTSDCNEIYETCQRRLLATETKGMLGKYDENAEELWQR